VQISVGFASWQRYCTASSSGRQPDFASLNRRHHLYSAGRPSRWALAYILVVFCYTCVWCIQVVSDCDGQTYCLNHAVECLRETPSSAPSYKLFIRCEEVSRVFWLVSVSSGEVLAWLSVWNEVQMIYIWSS